MKERRLRGWHGRMGVVLAVFFVLQAVSGFALGYGRARRNPLLSSLPDLFPSPGRGDVLRLLHDGPPGYGLLYHLLLALGLLWMVLTGVALYLRVRRRVPPSS